MEVWALMMVLQFTDPETKNDQFMPVMTSYDTKEDCEAGGAYAEQVAKDAGITVEWKCEISEQDDSGSQEQDGGDWEPSIEERS